MKKNFKMSMANELFINNNKIKERSNGFIIKVKIKNNKKSEIINLKDYCRNISSLIIKKQNKFLILLFNILIMINLFVLIDSRKIIIKLNFINQIKIKIQGEETQNILNSNFSPSPSEVTVNGGNSNILSGNIINGLNDEENIIIMKWDSKITSATNMFNQLNNLLEVDLSNFDVSEIETTDFMFSECEYLTSINLNNLNAPLLINVGSMFMECKSLLYLDLSSFIAPSIKYMGSMFSGCSSLKSIKFGNFQTSNVETFGNLFSSCSSLESIDLSNFDTNKVTSMVEMFSECTSLTSINLSNFHTNSLQSVNGMFSICTNLKYLDISNFDISNVQMIFFLFSDCENLEYINFNNFKEGSDYILLSSFSGVPDNITYCINNIDNMPKILAELNNKNCSINDCSEDWKTKIKKSIDEKRICVYDCSQDDTYIFEYKNKCYNNCPDGKTLSSDNKICLIVCPEERPFEKNEECIEDCSALDFFNNICIINNKNTNAKEKMVENIENQIDDDSFNSLLENILNNDNNDLIIKDINEIYQITTEKNQNNKEYINGEITINLGECENKLKVENYLNNDDSLIIYKMDYYINDLLIPITEYEIYNPITKEKLDLSICNEEKITINIPVVIDENDLYKYNPDSDYYKDRCYPSTEECGDENTLEERKNYFNNNYLSLCEKDCSY